MRVLCYVRPWSEKQFRLLATGAFAGAEVVCFSDFRGLGEHQLVDDFYRRLRNAELVRSGLAALDEIDVVDVRERCRLLRAIPQARAEEMIGAMAGSIAGLFDQARPDVIFSAGVDSYVIDLIRLVAQKMGIPFLAIAPCFAEGYFRVTARGEWIRSQDTPEHRVREFLDRILTKSFIPIYTAAQGQLSWRTGVARWSQNIKRFLYWHLRRGGRDPLNYHYYSSRLVSRSWLSIWPELRVADADWERQITEHPGRKIYFPLQFFPEATVNYWCRRRDVVDYHAAVLASVRSLAEHRLVLVKEHPGFYGFRQRSFYAELRAIPNVVLVDPMVPSNDFLDISDAVAVFTGTVGFEAAIRGIPVLSLGDSYYDSGRFIRSWTSFTETYSLLSQLDDERTRPITAAEQYAMAKHLLDGCLPGTFRYGDFAPENPDHLKELKTVAESLRLYAERSGFAVQGLDA